jgi:hypothetical protein
LLRRHLIRRVNFLQASNGHMLLTLLRRDRFDERLSSGDRRYARDIELERGLSNRLLIEVRGLAERSVDDDVDVALSDKVGDVRTAFVYFED